MKHSSPKAAIFIILFLINTLMAVIYNLENEIWQMMPIRLGAAFINGMGVTLLTILCLHYIHKYIHVNLTPFIIGVTWIILIIESFLLFNFYTLITPSCIMVALETNQQETSEFISSYFNIPTLILLATILIFSIFIFIYRSKIIAIKFPKWIHSPKFLILFCTITLLIYSGLTYYITQVRHMTSYQALTGIERVYHSIKSTIEDRSEYQKYAKLIQRTPPVITNNQSTVPHIIVILGESLSKWHMSAYGYHLTTTPKLDKRLKEKETYRFDSVIAARTVTAEAIRQIMTFYDETSKKPWYQYHTLPAVMQAAGYKTYWLSNQDSFNTGDDNSTAGIASTSSVIEFAHQRHASEERYGYFDEELLPLLDKELNSLPQKSFFLIHLMGSHRRYTNRYPTEFNQFNINDISRDISTEKKRTISEYDNSVLYNDYVIDEIIKRFETKDAIIFYFPDHGEEVYDTRNMSGHGLNNPTAPMKEIPLLIWTSALFKNEHTLLENEIKAATKRNFNTANIIHTIMNICDIKTEDYQVSKSLLYSHKQK